MKKTGFPARALVVWAVVSGAVAAAGLLVAPVATARTDDFAGLLTRVCAAALLACLAWAWAVTTAVAAEAATGLRRPVPGVPAAARRLVLAACGVAVAGTAVLPSQAAPPTRDHGAVEAVVSDLLDGRPAPGAIPASSGPAPAGRVVTVRPGDSLWLIAARQLPPDADGAQVTAYWQRLQRLNRAELGPDPDLIHPGQELRLPRPST